MVTRPHFLPGTGLRDLTRACTHSSSHMIARVHTHTQNVMANWEKAIQLEGPLLDELKSLYSPQFPFELRHHLASWIETQAWYDHYDVCAITIHVSIH